VRKVAVLGLLGALWLAPQRASDPFIPIGVWYGGPGIEAPDVARDPWKDVESWRRDLQAIRDAGFNSVTAWTNWAHAEPIEGRYRFDVLEHILRLAEGVGLQVVLEVFAEPAPSWVKGPPCGDGSAVSRMIAVANSRALAHRAFRALVLPAAPTSTGCLSSHALVPKPAGRPALTPAALGLALDGMRAGTETRGFWLSRLQVSPDRSGGQPGAAVTDADVRLWTWLAFARGARGIAFDNWHRMTEASGAPTRAAAAAGALAANFTRNASLFGSIVPRRPRVALLHTGGSSPSMALYQAAFERNVAVDLVQPGELLSGAGSRYPVLLVEGGQPPIVRQALEVFEQAGGTVITDPARLASIPPDIRIDGAPGLVEARFLESPDTWLIVAVNHADTPQKVTLGFGTDIPEAIWVDMETGNSMTFLQSASGPTLTHTFPARDVLVLVRNKRLR
jgi:hypothetical protein